MIAVSIFVAFLLYGYLIGSIPFGLIIGKIFNLTDIRHVGSGNIGATNVLRTGNKIAAALTLAFDAAKGFLVAWFGVKFLPHDTLWLYSLSLTPIIGHIWPVWLRFRGGKGVATALGVYLALNPLLAVLIMIVWLITAKLFRISSLSALVGLGLAPLLGAALMPWNLASLVLIQFCLLVSVLIFYTHRHNVKRLYSGQESQIKI